MRTTSERNKPLRKACYTIVFCQKSFRSYQYDGKLFAQVSYIGPT